jgi:hypothetical protein
MLSKAKTAYFIVGLIIFALIAIQNTASNLAPYMEAKNIEASALSENYYRTSWIGNTFGGGDKWIQNFVSAIYVAPDGTVYTNSIWDEAGREAGIYFLVDVAGMGVCSLSIRLLILLAWLMQAMNCMSAIRRLIVFESTITKP